jgi:hypothetical protein
VFIIFGRSRKISGIQKDRVGHILLVVLSRCAYHVDSIQENDEHHQLSLAAIFPYPLRNNNS